MKLRVVIADDSPAVRQHLAAMLASDSRFDVVGMARDGEEAVDLAQRLRPDVMTLDIEMPRLDGVAATERIMATAPCPIVIISSVAPHDANHGFRALAAGALEIVRKPEGVDAAAYEQLRRSIVSTLALMAEVKVVRRWGAGRPKPVPTRPHTEIVGICASTGGPPALESILRNLTAFPLPIVIVQHIANGFASNLVDWLQGSSAIPVKLATNGMRIDAGCAYVAPDDHHLVVRDRTLALMDAPPIRHHRPSGDALFSSLSQSWGASATGVILTGMGSDGSSGLQALHDRGGRVLAQEIATCVIGSMPAAVIDAGIADEVLPLEGIARRLGELAG